MMELLNWMGDHVGLTIILALAMASIVRNVCKMISAVFGGKADNADYYEYVLNAEPRATDKDPYMLRLLFMVLMVAILGILIASIACSSL